MIWIPTTVNSQSTTQPQGPRDWSWSRNTPDGFGLPLIGAILGYQVADEPDEFFMTEESRRLQG